MKMNETVAGLTITAKTEGFGPAKKDVDGLTKSTEQLGVVSEKTTKSSLSLEDAYKKQTLRFDQAARSAANFAREAKIVNQMRAEEKISAEQAADRLNLLSQRYGQASTASKAFAAATSGVSGQLIALSAGAGPVGTFLAALGPWGVAASVGLGAVVAVFDRLNEGAKRIGDKSIELKKFSEVTGLSVTEIKGLAKAGAELSVSSDDIKTSIEHFSVGLNEARKGTGNLFDEVRRINPALALQLAQAKGTAQGFDILAQALKGATDAEQRNALARAAFGRGGLETGLVAAATVDKGGVAAMGDQIAKNTGLTKEWVAETARLRQENIELEKATKAAMDAAYALPVLQRQNEYLKTLKEIADLAVKSGGINAPGADDPGAAFADYLSPPQPQELIGPVQTQEEAKAQRELQAALQDTATARANELAALTLSNNTSKERLGILGNEATESEKLTLRLNELRQAYLEGKITQSDYFKLAATALDTEPKLTRAQADRAQAIKETTKAQEEQNVVINSAADAWRAYEQGLISWSRANDEAGNATQRLAAATEDVAYWANQAASSIFSAGQAALIANSKFVPFATTWKSLGPTSLGTGGGQQGPQGLTQFDPGGYESNLHPTLPFATQQSLVGIYGEGGYDPYTGQPTKQGMEFLTKLPETLRETGMPENKSKTMVDEMIKKAADDLAAALKENTDATRAQTDVLSPFYSQDPRGTHLGFRAFAGGGIMTQYGELPLKQYQGGGIANSPQVAVFGEGSTPEAYVPAPAGKIPVEIKTPANSNQRPVHVTINVMGNADAGTVAALKTTAFQQAQTMRRVMR